MMSTYQPRMQRDRRVNGSTYQRFNASTQLKRTNASLNLDIILFDIVILNLIQDLEIDIRVLLASKGT